MIEHEVGTDVFEIGSQICKLALFEQWLYGSRSVIEPRLAPSIIARSEAELLGISSPRFAIRVYLGKNSFVNIRRRKVTVRQIRKTYDDNTADHFQEIAKRKKKILDRKLDAEQTRQEIKQLEVKAVKAVNWIADCLLEAPPRLLMEGFAILECSLGDDYGEDQILSATPFVTHISIGGGLCAQAACFMALCLLENTQIYGISEITRLAAEDQDHFEIHGLRPRTIERFMTKSVGLGAQLQCVPSPRAEDEFVIALGKIRCALRTYVENKIPVLLMLSASRMQGLKSGELKPSMKDPIIESSGNTLDPMSRKLPLGSPLNYSSCAILEQTDAEHDPHCVVVVGCKKDASCFLINDPATMPFVKASVEQLFDSRSYRSFPKSKNAKKSEYDIGPPVSESDLGEFQFISVAPQGVNLWLLHLVGRIPQQGGLIQAVQNSLVGGTLGIDYPIQVSRIENIRLHLGCWDGNEMKFRSDLTLDEPVRSLVAVLPSVIGRWYWVSEINASDKSGKYIRSLSFWDASHSWEHWRGKPEGLVIDRFLVCVVAQRSDGGWDMPVKGPHVA